MSITIEKVSYAHQKDARILEAVLVKWFQNPKELNLTSPNMPYPFRFKKWVSMNYSTQNIDSFVIKFDDWIVGIGNLKIMSEAKRAHAFHIFIDKKYRHQGLGEKIMNYLESLGKKEKMESITLWVMPKNEPAIKLYEKLGFIKKETSKQGSLFMEKPLV
ncbi:MAG: GNAT family N-acetyltransferase [Candidatus Marinimicrobia bacterium]|nr:GNAT family N-acetyltransferase [Candidatus Neomarinimicrobiota bacterium]MBL7010138.1 GNAT family N-acetyltransferase [Candidatus Neomarinimicrobiota bacterium]MBL7030403.1 GNAT family N-acetyltransferase [Candidatus Neomarinimicrobiota bacterium]